METIEVAIMRWYSNALRPREGRRSERVRQNVMPNGTKDNFFL